MGWDEQPLLIITSIYLPVMGGHQTSLAWLEQKCQTPKVENAVNRGKNVLMITSLTRDSKQFHTFSTFLNWSVTRPLPKRESPTQLWWEWYTNHKSAAVYTFGCCVFERVYVLLQVCEFEFTCVPQKLSPILTKPASKSAQSWVEEESNQNGFINDLLRGDHLFQYAKCSKGKPVSSSKFMDRLWDYIARLMSGEPTH